jgi:hypothetical protein
MDSLSNEVKLEFSLNTDSKLRSEWIRAKNPVITARIEGKLVVSAHDGIVFEDNYVLLLELGSQLSNWLSACKVGQICDFRYQTIDYDEGPILLFLRRDGNKFTIDSPWKQFESTVEVDSVALMRAVEVFLGDLRNALWKEFRVKLNDYINQP